MKRKDNATKKFHDPPSCGPLTPNPFAVQPLTCCILTGLKKVTVKSMSKTWISISYRISFMTCRSEISTNIFVFESFHNCFGFLLIVQLGQLRLLPIKLRDSNFQLNVHITFCCISEMTSNTDLAVELDELQSELLSYVDSINKAFSVLEARVSAWQLRRQEILRTEFKKLLLKMKERDDVSYFLHFYNPVKTPTKPQCNQKINFGLKLLLIYTANRSYFCLSTTIRVFSEGKLRSGQVLWGQNRSKIGTKSREKSGKSEQIGIKTQLNYLIFLEYSLDSMCSDFFMR